ncbi:hypothetical protein VTO42DRAFT_6051 [Malbranchea cinnamomea]
MVVSNRVVVIVTLIVIIITGDKDGFVVRVDLPKASGWRRNLLLVTRSIGSCIQNRMRDINTLLTTHSGSSRRGPSEANQGLSMSSFEKKKSLLLRRHD